MTTNLTTRVSQSCIEDLIGGTPMVKLRRVTAGLSPDVEVWAKLEGFNPGGSVKDRPALNMIREGIASNALTPEKILIDATSGNTGLAYAMIGASMGYRIKLCVPANVTPERLRLLKAYGADIVLTDAGEGTDGAICEARKLFSEKPELYFYPDQYGNDANWQAHYQTTGIEIWEQTHGRITHFVAALGTSGTMMGTGRRLREYKPDITLVSCQPDSPFHGLEGWKHMDTAMVPEIYDETLCDRNVEISTEDAQALLKRIALEEGMTVSPSSAAACTGALEVAAGLKEGVVVTVFPDDATKYLSERFWDDA